MPLLDYHTFIKGSNYCGLNVKWFQLLVPFVKIMGHQKQRLLKIVGRSDVEAAGDRGAIRCGDCWRWSEAALVRRNE